MNSSVKKELVLILIKPDIMAKGLMGHILSRFAELDLELIALKSTVATRDLAEKHYGQLRDKPFFNDIVEYLQGNLHRQNKIVVIVYAGKDAIRRCRELAGATNPEEADPRSIRGSLGRITTAGVYENAVHVSSNPEEAEREIKLWFLPEELGTDTYPTKTIGPEFDKMKVWV